MRRVAPAPKQERRRSQRVEPSRSARLVDISAGGIALETPAPIREGQLYDLILTLDDRRMPISALAVRVRKNGSLHLASFSFDRILDSDRAVLEQTLVREVVDRIAVVFR